MTSYGKTSVRLVNISSAWAETDLFSNPCRPCITLYNTVSHNISYRTVRDVHKVQIDPILHNKHPVSHPLGFGCLLQVCLRNLTDLSSRALYTNKDENYHTFGQSMMPVLIVDIKSGAQEDLSTYEMVCNEFIWKWHGLYRCTSPK